MPEPKELTLADIKIGDTASFEATLSEETVRAFAAFSGDYSPLHMNAEYAARTSFGARIPHGMIAGALFSRLVGMELPGKYAAYLSQTLSFHHPLPLSGTVTVKGEVIEKSDTTQAIKVRTTVTDTAGVILIRGEAFVRVLQ